MLVSELSKKKIIDVLKKEELIEQLRNTQKIHYKATVKVLILINTCIKDEGVVVDSAEHETFYRVTETTKADFDENSPQ